MSIDEMSTWEKTEAEMIAEGIINVPRCENCLKSLDDQTHKAHGEKIMRGVGVDYVEDYELVCDEPTRQECDICGNIFDLQDLLFEPPEFDGVCEGCLADMEEGAWDD